MGLQIAIYSPLPTASVSCHVGTRIFLSSFYSVHYTRYIMTIKSEYKEGKVCWVESARRFSTMLLGHIFNYQGQSGNFLVWNISDNNCSCIGNRRMLDNQYFSCLLEKKKGTWDCLSLLLVYTKLFTECLFRLDFLPFVLFCYYIIWFSSFLILNCVC